MHSRSEGGLLPLPTVEFLMPPVLPPRSDDLAFRIARLELRSDDILVLRFSVRLTDEMAWRIRKQAAAILGSDARVMILDRSTEITVLTREEIEARTSNERAG